MIIIGIVLCIVGLLVLILSWRGRIVARGQYCRKCRFDLAGLDIDSADAKCPECGDEVHEESSRRIVLRRRSRLGLATAALFFLGGITTIGVWSSGNASVILKVMPNPIVLRLTDMGMDAALDELVIRVSSMPTQLSSSQTDRAIKMGLDHQADLLVGFDPRWGEVLYVVCFNGQMTDDQLTHYMINSITVDVLIRDRVHRGAKQIDALMKISTARMDAVNGGYTGYSVEAKWVADGVVGQPARKSSLSFNPSALVSAPGAGGWHVNSAPSPIVPTGGALDGEIGSKLNVYTEYDLVLSVSSDQYPARLGIPAQTLEGELMLGHFTVEHEVEIIDPAEPIVPAVHDPELAQRVCETIGVSLVHLLKDIPDPEPGLRTKVLSMSTYTRNLPANIALQAYFRLDDGQEIRVGQWSTKGSGGDFLSGFGWSVDNSTTQSHADTQASLDKMIKQGKVDVIFRTDASLAEYSPEIEQVIDLNIVIEDVPIEVVDNVSRSSSSTADKWFKGKLMDDEPETAGPEQSP